MTFSIGITFTTMNKVKQNMKNRKQIYYVQYITVYAYKY